jgi:hypothetical protein
MEEAHV